MSHVLKGFMRYCAIDLLNAYNKAWEDPKIQSHTDAIRKAINLPASRFWLSPDEAARNICRIEQGKSIQIKKGTNKYDAFIALYEVYKRFRKHRFKTESVAFVASFACLEPAPRFYISFDRARRIIDKLKSGAYVVD